MQKMFEKSFNIIKELYFPETLLSKLYMILSQGLPAQNSFLKNIQYVAKYKNTVATSEWLKDFVT